MDHPSPSDSLPAARRRRWLHASAVVGLLLLTSVLAVSSLVGDSVTYDETSHLTAGMSYLKTGDFRLAPDHPPLGKIWAAWPVLLTNPRWPDAGNEHWCKANVFRFGRAVLFELNDGQRLILMGRGMMVFLLLATCLTIYALARTLFGHRAGLLSLALAALSPTLLAHGRLVTTDIPITLCTSLALLAFARVSQRFTWPWLVAAALSLTAASLSKMSWPLVLPALVVMMIWATVRKPRMEVGEQAGAKGIARPRQGARLPSSRRDRIAAIVGVCLVAGLAVWVGIWTCYGWRTSIVPPVAESEATPEVRAQLDQVNEAIAFGWQLALYQPDGSPRPGLVPAFLRMAVDVGVLPDAYLLGLAQTLTSTSQRLAYLCGDYSSSGWPSYFPIAAAIKTPIPTMLLFIAGLVALLSRRLRGRDNILLAGLVVFAVVYGLYVVQSRLNIGHRHLLPLYPAAFVLAGGSVVWWKSRVGRWLIGAALGWLLIANIWIHPHYLAYFNELVGGPARGHHYLADSNMDWGQDLLRLADYADQHPDESIKVSYFGSALPTRYMDCSSLPSSYVFEPRARLTAGTYVVSVTQLLGVYDAEIRDAFWTDRVRDAYGQMGMIATAVPAEDEPQAVRDRRTEAAEEFRDLREKRLLSRLRARPQDDRIGWSLFVYRLTDADIAQLTQP